MSILSVLDVARTALSVQQYGVDVTGHNIANVNTPEYSRQSPIIEGRQPAKYAGLLFGRGVDVDSIVRSTDQLVEKQLRQEKSSLSSSQEMENYMRIFEGLFNENSETSISALLSGFWNSWQDISNNPSGVPERIALYEHSSLLSGQLNTLSSDLTQLETDLTSAVSVGIEKINQITSEIATLNSQIVGMEVDGSTANDLRDQRIARVSELSEYLDVQTFEQENGALTVVTSRGGILVSEKENFDLEMGGTDGDRVLWENSSGTTVDITNYLTNGKLGGWLEMRDEIVAKYKLDLDAVTKEFVWSVNQQHSQGAGLEAFNTVTGAYQATDTTAALDSSGLTFEDEIVDGGFRLWLYDSSGAYDSDTTVIIDVDLTEIDDIVDAVNAIDPAKIAATTINNKLQISGVNGYTFAFSDDTSNVLAALGVNTFFQGSSSGSIGVNTVLNNKDYIAAAQIDAGTGNFAAGDNINALAVADLQFTSAVISQWTIDRINGNTEGSVTATVEGYYHAMVGSIGVTASSISRSKEFNEVMVNKLGNIRDSISAVSLDEEMANLIKFQHAYAAAAKLINVADEMYVTLLEVK